VQQQGTRCAFTTSESWVILSPIEQSIKQKIEAVGTPLKDWDIQINYGIKTGFNDAFIVSTETRDNILQNCKTEEERIRTAELIRPILRGRDIKRYGYEWAGLYLIATFPSRHYDIEAYPAVKSYLLSYGMERLEQTGVERVINGEKVKARKKTNNKWFEVQDSISYWDDFNKPKIVWIELSDEAKFTLSNSEIPLNTIFFMTGPQINHIIGFLNSPTILWYFTNCLACTSGVGTTRWLKFTIEKLPIPKPEETNIDLSELTTLCPNLDIEKKIDKLVGESYGLSPKEVEYLFNLIKCNQIGN
jgi:hypothetical protein